MNLSDTFNTGKPALREVVLDIETTGLSVADGHRMIEVAAIELVNGRPTGVEFYVRVNPERDIPADVVRVHGITGKDVAHLPPFRASAQLLRDFIGDAPVVITCRTHENDYVLDKAVLNMEFERARVAPLPDHQWVNVRRWSEDMFGDVGARLDNVLDHYGIDRDARKKHHNAALDARLLAAVYGRLKKDYLQYAAQSKRVDKNPKRGR